MPPTWDNGNVPWRNAFKGEKKILEKESVQEPRNRSTGAVLLRPTAPTERLDVAGSGREDRLHKHRPQQAHPQQHRPQQEEILADGLGQEKSEVHDLK